MILLHTINSADPASGGPIESVKQIGYALESLGVKIEVVSGDAPDEPWLRDFPFPIYPLGPAIGKFGYIPDFADWLLENASKYDGIIVNGIWQYQSHGAHGALKQLGLPYFVYPHGMLDPWFQQQYPLKHLKKRAYWRYGEYPVLRDAEAVMFTCEEEKRLATESFAPHEWRSRVVNFGTVGSLGEANAERSAFLAHFPALAKSRNILFLGRITEKKGLDMLLTAFGKVAQEDPCVRLVLAGPVDVALEAPLSRLAATLELGDRMVWTGMLHGDLKWGALRAADAFVLPSHQENFGISVAEALSCGVPVLISNKVNIWREIEKGGAGRVEDDTQDGTLKLLQGWLGMSEEQRAIMRANARSVYRDRFDIAQNAKSLLSAFTRVEEPNPK